MQRSRLVNPWGDGDEAAPGAFALDLQKAVAAALDQVRGPELDQFAHADPGVGQQANDQLVALRLCRVLEAAHLLGREHVEDLAPQLRQLGLAVDVLLALRAQRGQKGVDLELVHRLLQRGIVHLTYLLRAPAVFWLSRY